VTSAAVPDGVFLARPEPPADAGPGRRLAVKDLFDTADLATTYGSVLFANHRPAATAEAVRRLEAAGYVDVGKTNLHEFAYGVTSINPHFGTVPNPLAPGRIAGGSSGGSAAALGFGLADAALGTDSGGSIRIPAACCGVVGFKPTYDFVPLDGCFPLAPSFDHAGPLGPSVAGCVELMELLAEDFAATALDLSDLEVGVAWLEQAAPLVRLRVEEAAALFPRHRRVELPQPEDRPAAVFMREVADVHRELFAEHPDAYGEDTRGKIERCLAISDGEYERELAAREDYREQAARAFEEIDLLLTPTLPFVAPKVDLTRDEIDVMTLFTYPFNALGWPALALPCGPAEDGLPASVQLVAPSGEDARILAAGAALEAALAG
jgi:aspartyl-tRNA(Asn)/glutamyl-tRNA(Gln) amidotransferase subunit A